MKCKMIVFDIDGTLAPYDEPISVHTAEMLHSLRDKGIKITIASGKNISYVMGFMRGIGLPLDAGIGENGAVFYYTDDKGRLKISVAPRPSIMDELKKRTDGINNIWFQENQVNLTIFADDVKIFSQIIKILDDIDHSNKIQIFKHLDSIEIVPFGISKGQALNKIKQEYNLFAEEIIAVGDEESDVSMINEAGKFIIVGNKLGISDFRFPDTQSMLSYLITMIN